MTSMTHRIESFCGAGADLSFARGFAFHGLQNAASQHKTERSRKQWHSLAY